MFSSCVEAVDLRLSDSDVALVFLKRASPNAPAYSRALQPVCPNMGKAFKRLSVDKEEIMFVAGLAGSPWSKGRNRRPLPVPVTPSASCGQCSAGTRWAEIVAQPREG